MDARQALERVAVTFDRPVVPEPLTDGYTGDFDPALSPDDDRLVFSTSRTGNRTLWSASTRLERPAPLTAGVAFDERPVYSPDGREIAFVSDRGERRGIWIVNREGGTPRLLAYANVIDTLSWSPDGRRLVYATPIGDAPGLMIVNVADGTTSRLPTPAAANGPAWSRDDVIAYVEPRGGSNGTFAQLIAPDGRPVTSSPLDGRGAPQIANGSVAWSPDGKRLAAASLPGTGVGSVWIVDPNNAAPYRKLLDLPAGAFVRGIAWTRDGSRSSSAAIAGPKTSSWPRGPRHREHEHVARDARVSGGGLADARRALVRTDTAKYGLGAARRNGVAAGSFPGQRRHRRGA